MGSLSCTLCSTEPASVVTGDSPLRLECPSCHRESDFPEPVLDDNARGRTRQQYRSECS